MTEEFDPKTFTETQIKEIKKTVGNEKVLIALSGGVDSSTCAVLTHLALGENLLCVMLDDAFMREGEPERVAHALSQPPLNLPVKIEHVQKRFLDALKGLQDAEEKRKAFRETFYRTLGEIAKREKSTYMVQGTILADIIETKGGIKTQHNVLEQMGISTREVYGFKVVEPLVSLLKWQVREVARHLKIPPEISERQPFPGPGLSVRVVGEIRPDKLASLKRATTITEKNFAGHKPSQYFAVIVDNVEAEDHPAAKKAEETAAKILGLNCGDVSARVLRDKATGMVEKTRRYGDIVVLSCRKADGAPLEEPVGKLVELQKAIVLENPSVTRVLYVVSDSAKKEPYVVSMRAVSTRDFLTAKVTDIPWSTLKATSACILEECGNVSWVCYDVTPKPPATVEME